MTQNVSDTLNLAADLIEERGWAVGGGGWDGGGSLCLEGGIIAALGLPDRYKLDRLACPAYLAVQAHLGNRIRNAVLNIDTDDLWAWNDTVAKDATEVVEVLRATAAIEAAREHVELTRVLDERLYCRIEFTETCWLWIGNLDAEGYGRLGGQLAHRLVYEATRGWTDLSLDHLCRVRNCVNPDHLEPVTVAENNRRALAAKTTCVNGHDLVDDNVISRGRGRRCRVCVRTKDRANYHKRMTDKKSARERKSAEVSA